MVIDDTYLSGTTMNYLQQKKPQATVQFSLFNHLLGWSLFQQPLGRRQCIHPGQVVIGLTQRDTQLFMLTFTPIASLESLINLTCMCLNMENPRRHRENKHYRERSQCANSFEPRNLHTVR